MRTPLIAGNWKMNGAGAEAEALLSALAGAGKGSAEMLVCPPFTMLAGAEKILNGSTVHLGAQNVYPAEGGAFTGEISPSMLKSLGCCFCICGHSERRQILGETNDFINEKVRILLAHCITPVLCVGETGDERAEGLTAEVLRRELEEGLSYIGSGYAAGVVIAYEPVWAIGAGKPAAPDEAEEAAAWIRECLFQLFGSAVSETVRILYGGSVNAANAASFLAQPDIDGALVGGASLKAEEFIAIYEAACGCAGKASGPRKE